MRNKLNSPMRFYLVFIALLCYSTMVSAQPPGIYEQADLINPPDIAEFNGKSDVHIQQRLQAGDTMSATFTSNNVVITNKNKSVPEFRKTVGPKAVGTSFDMAHKINGKVITDIHQTHTVPGVASGTLELAAYKKKGLAADAAESVGLGSWFLENGYTSGYALTVPDFMTTNDIYYGVDLSIWAPNGFPVNDSLLGQVFSITNGTSAALPGFLFSTAPLFASESGWDTDLRFSGDVTLDSFHAFSVPEPGSLALCGLAALALIRLRKSAGNAKSAGAPGEGHA